MRSDHAIIPLLVIVIAVGLSMKERRPFIAGIQIGVASMSLLLHIIMLFEP